MPGGQGRAFRTAIGAVKCGISYWYSLSFWPKEHDFPSTAEKIFAVWVKGWRKLGYGLSPQGQLLSNWDLHTFPTPYKKWGRSALFPSQFVKFWAGEIPKSDANLLHLEKPRHRAMKWLARGHSATSGKAALDSLFPKPEPFFSPIQHVPSFYILLHWLAWWVTEGPYFKDECWKLGLRLKPEHMAKVTEPHSDHPWPQSAEVQVLS